MWMLEMFLMFLGVCFVLGVFWVWGYANAYMEFKRSALSGRMTMGKHIFECKDIAGNERPKNG